MKLDSLAAYWNTASTKFYTKMEKKEWLAEMQKNVAYAGNKTDYIYCKEIK